MSQPIQGDENQTSAIPSFESQKTDSSDAEFTPGPWAVGDFEGMWVTGLDGSVNVICDIVARKYASEEDDHSAIFTDEDRANARLIAAAPAMYETLAALLTHLRTYHDSSLCQYIANANAALDMADGKPVPKGDWSR